MVSDACHYFQVHLVGTQTPLRKGVTGVMSNGRKWSQNLRNQQRNLGLFISVVEP